jgi:Amt family ammonium transporter
MAGGIACYFAVTKLKSHFNYDDSLDVFGVHGIGSVVGMLLLGWTASATINPAIATTFHAQGAVVNRSPAARRNS